VNDLKTNNFQDLSHEEAESVGGGFHFVVGVIREGQSVANVGLNLASAIADASDSVLNRVTGCISNRFNGSGGSESSGNGNGSGLLGGLFSRRW